MNFDLIEAVEVAMDQSVDACARCKVCDRQAEAALRVVVGELRGLAKEPGWCGSDLAAGALMDAAAWIEGTL